MGNTVERYRMFPEESCALPLFNRLGVASWQITILAYLGWVKQCKSSVNGPFSMANYVKIQDIFLEGRKADSSRRGMPIFG